MISVLIADDEELVRSGVRMILEAAGDISIAAEAGDGAEATEKARSHTPDVVLMDIRMPRVDGLTALGEILRGPKPARVIVLTTFDLDEYIFTALERGAAGFLVKNTPPQELAHAVRVVAAGDAMLSPSVTRRLIGHFAGGGARRTRAATRQLEALTDREREVLRLVGAGLSNADIARRQYMSEATVKAHVSRMLTKLGLTNRVQAAILAHDARLLDDQ